MLVAIAFLILMILIFGADLVLAFCWGVFKAVASLAFLAGLILLVVVLAS